MSKEAVVDGQLSTVTAVPLWAQCIEGAGKDAHRPVFLWKGFDCILDELLTSNQSASECYRQSFPLGQ